MDKVDITIYLLVQAIFCAICVAVLSIFSELNTSDFISFIVGYSVVTLIFLTIRIRKERV